MTHIILYANISIPAVSGQVYFSGMIMRIKINMYAADWLCLLIWICLFGLGNLVSAFIMLPVTLIFGILNYLYSRTPMKVFRTDINLMAVTAIGIVLNSLLFVTFIYGDALAVGTMVLEIVAGIIYVFVIAVISMLIKEHVRKSNARILSSMQADVQDETQDDLHDDEHEDENDDEDMPELEQLHEIDQDKPEEKEDKGPKFRVIVKNRNEKGNN